MIIDVLESGALVYEYDVAGVFYTATHEVGDAEGLPPGERWRLIGPARIKYATRNPANSMLLAESWQAES